MNFLIRAWLQEMNSKFLTYIVCLIILISNLNSCNKFRGEEGRSKNINQILITESGDSLEHGFWTYVDDERGLSKEGNYSKGMKTGEWLYASSESKRKVIWNVFDSLGVTINYPEYLVLSDSVKSPILFLGDIRDDDDRTYVVLLRYDLGGTDSLTYDYMVQLNDNFKNNEDQSLNDLLFRQFAYSNFDLFCVNAEVSRDQTDYQVISFIFESGGFLFDLTYRNASQSVDDLETEIFKDILYSFKFEGVDLFTINSLETPPESKIVFE